MPVAARIKKLQPSVMTKQHGQSLGKLLGMMPQMSIMQMAKY